MPDQRRQLPQETPEPKGGNASRGTPVGPWQELRARVFVVTLHAWKRSLHYSLYYSLASTDSKTKEPQAHDLGFCRGAEGVLSQDIGKGCRAS